MDWKLILEPCDVIISRGGGLDSRLIRHFNRGCFSHSCLAVGDGLMVEATYSMKGDSVETGVLLSPVDKYVSRDKVVLRVFGLSGRDKHAIVSWALSQVGKNFSHRKMLATILPLKPEGEGFFCSEIVCEAFRVVGLELFPGRKNCLIGPNDFLKSPLLKPVFVGVKECASPF